MAKRSQEKLKMDRIQAAMQPLVGQDTFAEFMAIVSDLKDEAVEFSLSFESVASERQSLVSKGEIRAYLNILGVYKSQLEQLESQSAASSPE